MRRDAALQAWGERGRIAETCARLRCAHCRKRGMTAALAPYKAGLGSPNNVGRLLAMVRAIKAEGEVR
jgi:hypothetical protein